MGTGRGSVVARIFLVHSRRIMRIMMVITREHDFVSRAAGEWHDASERVIAIIRE
jgi:hypothetical protein